MSITIIKITNAKLIEYRTALLPLTKKSCAISWSITRSFSYVNQAFELYKKELTAIIDTFADKKETSGKQVVQFKDEKGMAVFNNIVFKDEQKAYEAYEILSKEIIELKVYKPTNEDLIAYLKTNPPTNEYFELDKILFDLDKIEI